MSKHIINHEHYYGHEFNHDLATAYGGGDNKRLRVRVILAPYYSIDFIVSVESEAILVTNDLKAAVEAYNKA